MNSSVCLPDVWATSDRHLEARTPFRSEFFCNLRRTIDPAGFCHAVHQFAGRFVRLCGRRGACSRRQVAPVRRCLLGNRCGGRLVCKRYGLGFLVLEQAPRCRTSGKSEEEQQFSQLSHWVLLVAAATLDKLCAKYLCSHTADWNTTIATTQCPPLTRRAKTTVE